MEKQGKDWMDIARYFYWSKKQLHRFSQDFGHALEEALQGRPSSLQAEKSYLPLPSGNEQGTYLALDFGGTNIRVSRIRLTGNHGFMVEKKISRPLRQEGVYDLTTPETTADELFDYIASLVGQAAGGNRPFYLGHTFSFGVAQEHVQDGRLLQWSKEIAVSGADGQLVNDLLRRALVRRGLDRIQPAALLNDTTALLLAAAYQHGCSHVAVICGTGFNICYYEPALQMVIILEAGDYKGMDRTQWDVAVDEASQQPGYHQLEKMVSGAYLCKIYEQTVMSYLGTAVPSFSTVDMNRIVGNENCRSARMMAAQLWRQIVAPEDLQQLRSIGASIFVRSAQLTGAACFGVLRHLYGSQDIPVQTLAIEGSVLEHVRGSLFILEDALQDCYEEERPGTTERIAVSSFLVKDGPSIGAAIAAAIAARQQA